jgi:hypothetical protein
MKKELFKTGLLALVIFLYGSPLTSAGSMGELCIGPVNNQNFYNEEFLKKAPKGYSPPKYSIQIDNGEIVKMKFNETIIYSPLSPDDNHIIKIWKNEKIYQSFRFNFRIYQSEKLCLWHKTRDESWALWALKDSTHFCNCPNQ